MTTALMVVFCLLLIGFYLRVRLRLLQWIYIPASIVAGLIGLLVVQTAKLVQANSDTDLGWLTEDVVKQLSTWPGWLIAVVFAGMFLERKSRSFRDSLRLAGREGIVVWIIVLGQTAIGLLVTWLLIQPFYDVPNSFGMLIETGFAGGHGTAGAMGDVLKSDVIGLRDGLDLGIFMATIGLVFSVTSGVIYVNIAIRRGWTQRPVRTVEKVTGLEDRAERPVIARGTVRADVLEPMVFQAIPLALAFGIGLGCSSIVKYMAQTADTWMTPDVATVAQVDEPANDSDGAQQVLQSKTSWAGIFGNFPLFIFTMFGGLVVRQIMERLNLGDLIDPQCMQRFTGAAMDFLVVSAITSLSLQAIGGVFVPLLLLLLAGFVWTGFCLLYVARKLLPKEYWFELGTINYGMSTGTTATGFVLLKMIDRDLDSGAAENYALATPLSSPFIGGGILTFALPLLVLERFPISVSTCVLGAVCVGLYFMGRYWAIKQDGPRNP